MPHAVSDVRDDSRDRGAVLQHLRLGTVWAAVGPSPDSSGIGTGASSAICAAAAYPTNGWLVPPSANLSAPGRG